MNQALYHAVGRLGQVDNVDARSLFALVESGATLVDATDVFNRIVSDPDFPSVVLRPWYRDMVDGLYRLEGVKPVFASAMFFARPFGKAFTYVWYVADNGGQIGIGERIVVIGDTGGFFQAQVHMTENPTTENEWMSTWVTATAQAVYALASAKNAQWIDSSPNRATRRQTTGASGVRFRSIVIDMGTEKRRGHSAQGHGDVPWHKRRGHWKYYERPRFGREGEVGWFWVSESEVGDKKHGIIVQDYTVKPPPP